MLILCSATKAAVRRVSVVHIRNLTGVVGKSCTTLLDDIHAHCKDVKKNGSGGARAGMGDQGLMHPIGTHINMAGNMVRYKTSSGASSIPLLAKAVAASATLAAVTIPGVLRVIQDLEKDSAMSPVEGMDGEGKFARVGLTMDLSVNLSNSSHYDVNDGCQGFSIWTEDNPGTTKKWYFVLPNVEGQFPKSDRKFSGIAIELRHGVLISWDGRLIRHCTSHIESRTGNVYGSFFAAKSRIVKHGMQQALRAGATTSVPAGGASAGLAVPVHDDDASNASSTDSSSDKDEDVGDCDDESIDCGIEVVDGGNTILLKRKNSSECA